jgi:molybdopterin-guanine dinucleotide biosynthesis protein B
MAMMRPGKHVAALRPCDLVLAEGFKHEAIPKLEVYDPALGHAPLFHHDAAVLAVVTDADRRYRLAPLPAR